MSKVDICENRDWIFLLWHYGLLGAGKYISIYVYSCKHDHMVRWMYMYAYIYIYMCVYSLYVAYIYILDTYRRNDNRRKNKGRRKEDTGRLLYNIFTSLFIARFERVVQGLHVRGCWRPNINFIFWPHCYDRQVVSFLFSWCWGLLHRGFLKAPSVGCGLLYHIWSLAVWNSTGNYFGTPNSTELNNNSTPTWSPTGSLKSDV